LLFFAFLTTFRNTES